MQSARNRAFTLVELIVSAAITLLLATLMITVTSGMLGSWNRSRGAMTTSNQAKTALDQITEDLQGAIYQADGNVWLAASIQPAGALASNGWTVSTAKPDVVDASSRVLADCRFGRAGVWLRFFAPGMDLVRIFDENGDPVIDPETGVQLVLPNTAPCATGYQIVRQSVGTNAASGFRYFLFRSRVRNTTRDPVLEDTPDSNPSTAQDAGSFQVGFDLHPATANAYHQPDTTFSKNPGTITTPHRDTAIAMNVIDFGVRLLARDGAIIYPTFGHSEHLAASGIDPFPARLEIFLRVLTEEGANMIERLEQGLIDGDWWEIATAHSQVYTRSVEPLALPLF